MSTSFRVHFSQNPLSAPVSCSVLQGTAVSYCVLQCVPLAPLTTKTSCSVTTRTRACVCVRVSMYVCVRVYVWVCADTHWGMHVTIYSHGTCSTILSEEPKITQCIPPHQLSPHLHLLFFLHLLLLLLHLEHVRAALVAIMMSFCCLCVHAYMCVRVCTCTRACVRVRECTYARAFFMCIVSVCVCVMCMCVCVVQCVCVCATSINLWAS